MVGLGVREMTSDLGARPQEVAQLHAWSAVAWEEGPGVLVTA